MNGLPIAILSIYGYFILCWIVNLVQLLSCNFDAPWRDEVVHAIGLLGPAAGITVWM